MPPFDIQTYIGSDIAQFRHGGERPSWRKVFLVSLIMGSGPGGGDYRSYFLVANRKGWTLWEMGRDYDSGKPQYCRVAYCWPKTGCPAKEAAKRLLAASWEAERHDSYLSPGLVEKEGLLTSTDVERIEADVWAEEQRSSGPSQTSPRKPSAGGTSPGKDNLATKPMKAPTPAEQEYSLVYSGSMTEREAMQRVSRVAKLMQERKAQGLDVRGKPLKEASVKRALKSPR